MNNPRRVCGGHVLKKHLQLKLIQLISSCCETNYKDIKHVSSKQFLKNCIDTRQRKTASTPAANLSVSLGHQNNVLVIIQRPSKLKFVSYNYVGKTDMSVPQTLGHPVSWQFFLPRTTGCQRLVPARTCEKKTNRRIVHWQCSTNFIVCSDFTCCHAFFRLRNIWYETGGLAFLLFNSSTYKLNGVIYQATSDYCTSDTSF